MKDHETNTGGPDRGFPSTWSAMSQAPVDRERAAQRIADLYWKPVYCLIRRAWSKGNEDAKDLTQQFFLSVVLEGPFLERFAPERGRFRSYLKAAVTNFMRDAAKAASAQKRAGALSLELAAMDVADLVPDPHALAPEQVFDAAWKNVVLSRALEILEKRLRAEGKEAVFDVFRRYELGDGERVSYQTVADATGLTADTVKNHLTRARQEFRAAVMRAVSDYVPDETEMSIEIRELFNL